MASRDGNYSQNPKQRNSRPGDDGVMPGRQRNSGRSYLNDSQQGRAGGSSQRNGRQHPQHGQQNEGRYAHSRSQRAPESSETNAVESTTPQSEVDGRHNQKRRTQRSEESRSRDDRVGTGRQDFSQQSKLQQQHVPQQQRKSERIAQQQDTSRPPRQSRNPRDGGNAQMLIQDATASTFEAQGMGSLASVEMIGQLQQQQQRQRQQHRNSHPAAPQQRHRQQSSHHSQHHNQTQNQQQSVHQGTVQTTRPPVTTASPQSSSSSKPVMPVKPSEQSQKQPGHHQPPSSLSQKIPYQPPAVGQQIAVETNAGSGQQQKQQLPLPAHPSPSLSGSGDGLGILQHGAPSAPSSALTTTNLPHGVHRSEQLESRLLQSSHPSGVPDLRPGGGSLGSRDGSVQGMPSVSSAPSTGLRISATYGNTGAAVPAGNWSNVPSLALSSSQSSEMSSSPAGGIHTALAQPQDFSQAKGFMPQASPTGAVLSNCIDATVPSPQRNSSDLLTNIRRSSAAAGGGGGVQSSFQGHGPSSSSMPLVNESASSQVMSGGRKMFQDAMQKLPTSIPNATSTAMPPGFKTDQNSFQSGGSWKNDAAHHSRAAPESFLPHPQQPDLSQNAPLPQDKRPPANVDMMLQHSTPAASGNQQLPYTVPQDQATMKQPRQGHPTGTQQQQQQQLTVQTPHMQTADAQRLTGQETRPAQNLPLSQSGSQPHMLKNSQPSHQNNHSQVPFQTHSNVLVPGLNEQQQSQGSFQPQPNQDVGSSEKPSNTGGEPGLGRSQDLPPSNHQEPAVGGMSGHTAVNGDSHSATGPESGPEPVDRHGGSQSGASDMHDEDRRDAYMLHAPRHYPFHPHMGPGHMHPGQGHPMYHQQPYMMPFGWGMPFPGMLGPGMPPPHMQAGLFHPSGEDSERGVALGNDSGGSSAAVSNYDDVDRGQPDDSDNDGQARQPSLPDLRSLELGSQQQPAREENSFANRQIPVASSSGGSRSTRSSVAAMQPLGPWVDAGLHLLLEVGGRSFKVLPSTFTKYPDSLLGRMLAPDAPPLQLNERNALAFDRDGYLFECLLSFCRTGKVFTPPNVSMAALHEEAKFFGLYDHMFSSNMVVASQHPVYFSRDIHHTLHIGNGMKAAESDRAVFVLYEDDSLVITNILTSATCHLFADIYHLDGKPPTRDFVVYDPMQPDGWRSFRFSRQRLDFKLVSLENAAASMKITFRQTYCFPACTQEFSSVPSEQS